MRYRALLLATCTAALALPAPATAQEPEEADSARESRGGGGALPLKPTRSVRFTTEEGTWMSLDVAPDGRTLVFDLNGDIYTLPIGGGKALRVTSGMPFDAQPRFSPDGRRIVFVSDRDGSDDVWMMDADGQNAKQVTRTDRTQWLSPEWTPDGRYIVVSRNTALFSTTYNLYLYHRDGGAGVRMTGGSSAGGGGGPGGGAAATARNYVGPVFGDDPRYVYVSTRMGGAGGYNQTSFGWQVGTYDRETGRTSIRATGRGAAFKPVPSPDGRWLVFATREDSVTSLIIRDLESGSERLLRRGVQRDDMESRFSRDLLPNASFTPDSRALVTTWDGRIWRVSVPDGAATQIPFSADVELELGPLAKFEYPINDSTLTVGQIRDARPSPDGRRLAFTALDKLWVMDLPNGTPRRLTRTPHGTGEHSPVWSPDGRDIAYVTWSDRGGDIQRIRSAGGDPERLTRQSAYYTRINYTPDGRRIVGYRGPAQPRIEEEPVLGQELIWLPAGGGDVTSITPLNGGFPHFTRDNPDRVFVYLGDDGLVSMRFDGTDRREHVKVTGNPDYRRTPSRPSDAEEVLIAPDGTRALAMVDNNVYVLEVPAVGGQAPTVSVASTRGAPVPVRRLTRIGGDFAGWLDDRTAYYSIGRSFFQYDLARADSLVRDSTARAEARLQRRSAAAEARDSVARSDSARAAPRPVYEPMRVDVAITVPKDRPRGTLVLRNARIVTMRDDEVIERGDVLIRDNRIAAVGPAGSIATPAGAREMDLAGRTIVPGYVDTHAHLRPPFGIHKSNIWEYQANLAYGVTTTRDPQTGTTDVLSYGDLVETGDILGPRIFSTGPGVFWSDNISSLNDARDILRRYSDYYNTQTIKQYMVGDRKVRQWVIMAANELRLTPTLEGGLDFKKNLTEAIDGYAGIEHSLPIAPIFRDAVQLLAESGTTYTPTLLVLYGGPWAENYWYQTYDILADDKLRRFTPLEELQQRGFRRSGWWHPSQYAHELFAEQADKIVRAGGRVGVGSHGQLQGLGYHWELWTLASGGMRPHDALRAATIMGADALGLDGELGSVEGGKLADLVVLDANPLDDIRNTARIRYVMKNGRLYEAGILREVWPRQREQPRGWWQPVTADVTDALRN